LAVARGASVRKDYDGPAAVADALEDDLAGLTSKYLIENISHFKTKIVNLCLIQRDFSLVIYVAAIDRNAISREDKTGVH
jgi:hypothetical protein